MTKDKYLNAAKSIIKWKLQYMEGQEYESGMAEEFAQDLGYDDSKNIPEEEKERVLEIVWDLTNKILSS